MDVSKNKIRNQLFKPFLCILLKIGQTYFKCLVVRTLQDFKSMFWPFFNIVLKRGQVVIMKKQLLHFKLSILFSQMHYFAGALENVCFEKFHKIHLKGSVAEYSFCKVTSCNLQYLERKFLTSSLLVNWQIFSEHHWMNVSDVQHFQGNRLASAIHLQCITFAR